MSVCLCVWCFSLVFFLFKQKTAYEMRISDWSSDVCSSDLVLGRFADAHVERDLLDLRHFHDVLVTELRGHRLGDFGVIERLGAGDVLVAHYSTSPDLTATRTFLPSRSSKRTRVGLPSLSAKIGRAHV